MGKKRTIKAVFITLILTVLIVGLLVYFVGGNIIKEKDKKIADLGLQVSNIKAYAFSRDIKAGSTITPGDLKLISVTQESKSFGMYLEQGYYTGKEEQYDQKGNVIGYLDKVVPVDFYEDVYGRAVKNNVSENTVLLDSLLYEKNSIEKKDERTEEISDSFVQIPTDLNANDYIDIRIQYPDGQDYTVIVGKKVDSLGVDSEGNVTSKSFFVKLTEEERMVYTSALVESFIQPGTRLYATRYINAATQLFKETIEDYVAKYESGEQLAVKLKNDERAIELISGDNKEEQYKNMSEFEKETLRGQIKLATVDDLTIEDIAKAAGMSQTDVETIKDAKTPATSQDTSKKEDVEKINAENRAKQATLDYYRNYKIQTRTPLARTYVVTQAVLDAIKRHPDLANEVKYGFKERIETRESRDRYKELEEAYKTAPEEANTGWGETSNVKTKSQIQEEMSALAKSYEEKYNQEIKSQQDRRAAYVQALIYGN